jgi:ribA/ribD-fused uncharacterized protein
LSFHPAIIEFEGKQYPTVEHAYQAAKTENLRAREQFQITGSLTAGQAKRMGALLDLRPGWNAMKVGIMYQLLLEKFTYVDLRLKIISTTDAELIEGNDWGDTFWGVCNGEGENLLGKCLMMVRTHVKDIREVYP